MGEENAAAQRSHQVDRPAIGSESLFPLRCHKGGKIEFGIEFFQMDMQRVELELQLREHRFQIGKRSGLFIRKTRVVIGQFHRLDARLAHGLQKLPIQRTVAVEEGR